MIRIIVWGILYGALAGFMLGQVGAAAIPFLSVVGVVSFAVTLAFVFSDTDNEEEEE